MRDDDLTTLYHGTTVAGLTEILPAARTGARPVYPLVTDVRYAYVSSNASDAWSWAEKAWASTDTGVPRVYAAVALGPVEDDLDTDVHGLSRSIFSGDRRSRAGFRVIAEVPMPENMGPAEQWR